VGSYHCNASSLKRTVELFVIAVSTEKVSFVH
jgi:hypothetical protein